MNNLKKNSTEERFFDFDNRRIVEYDLKGGLNVVIPEKINGITVTSIGDSAFAENNLADVTIPDSVTSIWAFAFYVNPMKTAQVPITTTLGKNAFPSNTVITRY